LIAEARSPVEVQGDQCRAVGNTATLSIESEPSPPAPLIRPGVPSGPKRATNTSGWVPSPELINLRDARHTAPGLARTLAEQLAERVRLGRFSVDRVLVQQLRPVPVVCLIGRPA